LNAYLIAPNGDELAKIPFGPSEMPLPTNFYYLPWRSEYFWQRNTSVLWSSRLVAPNGTWSRRPTPKLLGSWSISFIGSGQPWWVRDIQVWSFVASPGYHLKQGLFAEVDEQLLRLDNAMPSAETPAPNGCRLFYVRVEGDRSTRRVGAPAVAEHTVIDFCERLK
jgi:hypothetical protein